MLILSQSQSPAQSQAQNHFPAAHLVHTCTLSPISTPVTDSPTLYRLSPVTSSRKQTDWLNRPSASHLTSQKSVNFQHIETPSPRYHTIETVSVPRTRKYRKRQNQFMSNHLIDVQQIKNVYNTQKQLIKLGLLNIRSLSTTALFVNDLINDHNLDL